MKEARPVGTYTPAMPGDPYVRETQRRVRRYNARLVAIVLVAVAILFTVVAIQSCGGGSTDERGDCPAGATCE